MGAIKQTKQNSKDREVYSRFKCLNGNHPLKKSVPELCVEYRARSRKGGQVSVFNFDLAKEMGLIPKDHPHELNRELEKKILETFSLVIINEYDEMNNLNYPQEDIRENTYMATRYLQLQHPNKQGKTSGDGRSIWNGQVTHKGKVWDISSCGTGATRLSPATHLKKKFFKTGDPSISYGCGYSEIEEGLSTLFFSEVLNQNNISTERILAVIEFPKGISINVRAHSNLLRPSHFFGPLKQSNFEVLDKLFDYYMANTNKLNWSGCPKKKNDQFDFFLNKKVETFAKMAARFESDYIFCWLDWDGDNILMDGGIIDYGSIRQFGLFHHEYRFDDVERFSTNIKEQKQKARYIVQTFCQMIDFLKTKKKKGISNFSRSRLLKKFDKVFERHKKFLLLQKIGLSKKDAELLLENHSRSVEKFLKVFCYFERAKSSTGLKKVGDGVNWNAIFCMRDILRELPQLLLIREQEILNEQEFLSIIKSSYATSEDLKLTTYRKKKIKDFQKLYLSLVKKISDSKLSNLDQQLLELTMRSSIINRYDRVTGDSITTIVQKLMKHRPKVKPEEYDKTLKDFVDFQNLNPDIQSFQNRGQRIHTKRRSKLSKEMFQIVQNFREGI